VNAEHERWMRRALELAERGLGETNPNPMVGCVIVKNGRRIAEGWHARAGGPHAEIVALRRAGPAARGATLYVNLEPCVHHGKTPPCAPAVARAGIRSVVAAMKDPDPRVDGRGVAELRAAGIAVTSGVLEPEAIRLNERFVCALRRRRPFVLLKAAMTLDGRIATARRESTWITSPAQRREARRFRRLHDAVMVGVGTVLADDPLLMPSPRVHRPFYRIVVDSRLRIPLASRLVRSARLGPVWVLGAAFRPRKRRRLEERGLSVLSGPASRGRVSLRWALSTLWQRGIRSVMVEGGSELLGSFLAARAVDQVALFRAPLILGGRGSLPAFGGPDPHRLSQALRMTPESPLLRGRGGRRLQGARGDVAVELWYPER
jgi:diaminohydroxyphosphoribosylaminopyrimidine deaminase/5-amino-6-(5-phosphoribosylamino)uracil reductase